MDARGRGHRPRPWSPGGRRRSAIAPAVLVLALVAAACSGADGDASEGVATTTSNDLAATAVVDPAVSANTADTARETAASTASTTNVEPPSDGSVTTSPPRSVRPELDRAAVVEAVIGPDGGTLELVTASGAAIRLDVPPGALPVPVAITMIPVTALGDLPFTGATVAAVRLEPSGFTFLEEATLTIADPSLPSSAIAFGWIGDGDDLHLRRRAGTPDGLEIPILHFSGAGAAEPSAGETDGMADAPPADPDAAVEHERARCAIDPNCDHTGLVAALLAALTDARAGLAAALAEDELAASALHRWVSAATHLRAAAPVIGDTYPPTLNAGLVEIFGPARRLATDILIVARERSLERCRTEHDPDQLVALAEMARFAEYALASHPLAFEPELAGLTVFEPDGCARFELVFESEIAIEVDGLGQLDPVAVRTSDVLLSPVTAELDVTPVGAELELVGSGEIASVERSDPRGQTRISTPDVFGVRRLVVELGRPSNVLYPPAGVGPPSPTASLVVDPGDPLEEWIDEDGPVWWGPAWRDLFEAVAADAASDIGFEFVLDAEAGDGATVAAATRESQRRDLTDTGATFSASETTTIELVHAPE